MRSRIAVVIAIGGWLAACSEAAPPADETPETTDTAGAMAEAPPAPPDTTAEAVWAHLLEANYQGWSLWPGKGELYRGTEPHGALLTTYVNDLAQDALTNGAAEMPAGAVVVKENYMPDSTLAATTVMLKAPGYDAEHADWFWAKYAPDGSVQASGRVETCAGCHAAAKSYDYLMTRMAQSGEEPSSEM